uniref:No apical meristem-associated C-terminal domain-containing protein n=1 Tax=Lactuca sativa TaxID=4236 RepID=A0A9R1UZ18_LACSA|nr:hypothetical protein LSAT_V11C700360080 [Lactuca sativa]
MVRPNTTQERVPLTKEEEEKLVEAWISASQDPIEGDSQTSGCFWEKVCVMFYKLTGSESRNSDQISSKWRDIRLNGANNFDIFKATLDQFEKITPTRKAFPYLKSWLKLKDAPKWKEQTEGSSQSSDWRTHFDINDDPLNIEDEQPLCRPCYRSTWKENSSLCACSINEGGDVELGITKNDRNTIGDSNKNRYENLENESRGP